MKHPNLLFKVKKTVEHHRLLERDDKVLIAVSGGVDSVCLLTLLLELKDAFALSFHLAHLNHSLRGVESDEDAEWVRALAGRLGIPVTIEKKDVLKWVKRKRCSLEEGARELRYEFLSKVADEVEATKIATGHTLDDQAETVLLRLLRGTGISGLGGVLPRRKRLIRPLIEVSREEVVEYLQDKGLDYREDSSNTQRDHLRNRLRLELIPLLKGEFNRRIVELLGRCAELAQIDDSYLDTVARGAFSTLLIRSSPMRIVLDWEKLVSLHPSLSRRAIRFAIKEIKGNLRGIRTEHILSCLELSTGKKLYLPSGLILTRQYENLIISLCEKRYGHFTYTVQVPGTVMLREIEMILVAEFLDKDFLPEDFKSPSPEEAYFDFDQIDPPLVVRNRRSGDRIHPLGMKGERKLKDILIDDKIPRNERDSIPLLADSNGLLWIIGNRRSERAKITPATKKVLRIRATTS